MGPESLQVWKFRFRDVEKLELYADYLIAPARIIRVLTELPHKFLQILFVGIYLDVVDSDILRRIVVSEIPSTV